MDTLSIMELLIEFFLDVTLLFFVESNIQRCQLETHQMTHSIIVSIAVMVIPVTVQGVIMPHVERANEALLDAIFNRSPSLYNLDEMTIEEFADVVRAVVLMDRMRRRMNNFRTRLIHRKVEEVARLDDEYRCSICYGEVEPGTVVTCLYPFCSHWFDTRCLLMWLLTNSAPQSCPMCRAEVDLDDSSIAELMEHWGHYFDADDDDIIYEGEWRAVNGWASPWDIYLSLES
jgi:hypothetical protein